MSSAIGGVQAVPEFEPDEKEHRRKIAHGLNLVMGGRLRGTLDVTLTASAGSTTITDPRLGYYSWLWPMPMTADAAAELGNGTLYIAQSTMLKGSAVITHANNAQADRTFRVLIISP